MTDLTDLPQIPGVVFLSNGFNDKGQMAGNAEFPDGSVHGFVGNSRQYEIFDYPAPDTFTIPSKINDAGVLVGTYDVAPEPFGVHVHAFMKVGAQLTGLDLPGTDGTSALSINNPGTIVGYYGIGIEVHLDNTGAEQIPGMFTILVLRLHSLTRHEERESQRPED
jgi:hypothetical protein